MLSRSKKVMIFSAAAAVIILILVVSAFMSLGGNSQPNSTPTPPPSTPTPTVVAQKKPFYFGITYCGNSTTEAKQLIDKVKNYTNLFVIQSGPLMARLPAMEEICDYAVNSGLDIIVYYAYNGAAENTCANFTKIAEPRWGSHFLGLYYTDEPGGKMLDSGGAILTQPNGTTVNVNYDNSICVSAHDESNNVSTSSTFYPSGDIQIYASQLFEDGSNEWNYTNYFTNGTISLTGVGGYSQNGSTFLQPDLWYQPNGDVQDENGTLVTGHGSISQFKPYQQVWDSCPLKTQADMANLYVNAKRNILSTTVRNQSNIKLMTSDYALYWYDYQAGFDTIFAQLGWNDNPTQEIGLVRGAARMQNKEWGTIITWQSSNPPALQTGQQIYDEMKQSYESGAEYVIVFNYAQSNPSGGNSTNTQEVGPLKEEHFEAMKKFWTDIVQNPQETNNVSAEAVLVLPNSLGWGMRNQQDTIWGLWNTTSTTDQIWAQLQNMLTQYGQKLDIIYDDPAYPVSGKYGQIVYWNQTG